MQAIILATADNEKLGPLTESTPSPLLSIGNRPVMEIVLEQLARAGIKKMIVPKENERDLADIPPQIQKKMQFYGSFCPPVFGPWEQGKTQ